MMFMVTISVGVVFGQKRSMTVMPFDVVGNAVTQDEAEAITELYISELIQANKVKIVDRSNFDKVLKELNFQNSDWSNSEKTAKLGRALNARFISRGKIMKLGKNYSISVSVIDITTSEIVASCNRKGENLDTIVEKLYSKIAYPIAADVFHSKGPAGGIIFRFDGTYFYETVFSTEEYSWNIPSYVFKFGGYDDWRLVTYDEAVSICHDLYEKDRGGVDSGYYWLQDGFFIRYYTEFVSWYGELLSYKTYTTSISKVNDNRNNKYRVCIVRKFKDE